MSKDGSADPGRIGGRPGRDDGLRQMAEPERADGQRADERVDGKAALAGDTEAGIEEAQVAARVRGLLRSDHRFELGDVTGGGARQDEREDVRELARAGRERTDRAPKPRNSTRPPSARAEVMVLRIALTSRSTSA